MTAYSRTTYQTVPTPDRATFTSTNYDDPLPSQSAAGALSQPVSTPLNEEDLQLGIGPTPTLWGRFKAGVKTNAGLLLVAASQAFFALMNVAVKKLNGIDPPVTALQVRLCLALLGMGNSIARAAYPGSDGARSWLSDGCV
jgi:hypothetical protein